MWTFATALCCTLLLGHHGIQRPGAYVKDTAVASSPNLADEDNLAPSDASSCDDTDGEGQQKIRTVNGLAADVLEGGSERIVFGRLLSAAQQLIFDAYRSRDPLNQLGQAHAILEAAVAMRMDPSSTQPSQLLEVQAEIDQALTTFAGGSPVQRKQPVDQKRRADDGATPVEPQGVQESFYLHQSVSAEDVFKLCQLGQTWMVQALVQFLNDTELQEIVSTSIKDINIVDILACAGDSASLGLLLRRIETWGAAESKHAMRFALNGHCMPRKPCLDAAEWEQPWQKHCPIDFSVVMEVMDAHGHSFSVYAGLKPIECAALHGHAGTVLLLLQNNVAPAKAWELGVMAGHGKVLAPAFEEGGVLHRAGTVVGGARQHSQGDRTPAACAGTAADCELGSQRVSKQQQQGMRSGGSAQPPAPGAQRATETGASAERKSQPHQRRGGDQGKPGPSSGKGRRLAGSIRGAGALDGQRVQLSIEGAPPEGLEGKDWVLGIPPEFLPLLTDMARNSDEVVTLEARVIRTCPVWPPNPYAAAWERAARDGRCGQASCGAETLPQQCRAGQEVRQLGQKPASRIRRSKAVEAAPVSTTNDLASLLAWLLLSPLRLLMPETFGAGRPALQEMQRLGTAGEQAGQDMLEDAAHSSERSQHLQRTLLDLVAFLALLSPVVFVMALGRSRESPLQFWRVRRQLRRFLHSLTQQLAQSLRPEVVRRRLRALPSSTARLLSMLTNEVQQTATAVQLHWCTRPSRSGGSLQLEAARAGPLQQRPALHGAAARGGGAGGQLRKAGTRGTRAGSRAGAVGGSGPKGGEAGRRGGRGGRAHRPSLDATGPGLQVAEKPTTLEPLPAAGGRCRSASTSAAGQLVADPPELLPAAPAGSGWVRWLRSWAARRPAAKPAAQHSGASGSSSDSCSAKGPWAQLQPHAAAVAPAARPTSVRLGDSSSTTPCSPGRPAGLPQPGGEDAALPSTSGRHCGTDSSSSLSRRRSPSSPPTPTQPMRRETPPPAEPWGGTPGQLRQELQEAPLRMSQPAPEDSAGQERSAGEHAGLKAQTGRREWEWAVQRSVEPNLSVASEPSQPQQGPMLAAHAAARDPVVELGQSLHGGAAAAAEAVPDWPALGAPWAAPGGAPGSCHGHPVRASERCVSAAERQEQPPAGREYSLFGGAAWSVITPANRLAAELPPPAAGGSASISSRSTSGCISSPASGDASARQRAVEPAAAQPARAPGVRKRAVSSGEIAQEQWLALGAVMLRQAKDMFLCPITQEVMTDPVVAADGYTYERHAIEGWLRRAQTSPTTNAELDHTHLVPNLVLRIAIQDLREGARGQDLDDLLPALGK